MGIRSEQKKKILLNLIEILMIILNIFCSSQNATTEINNFLIKFDYARDSYNEGFFSLYQTYSEIYFKKPTKKRLRHQNR